MPKKTDLEKWWTRFFLDQEYLENIILKFMPERSKDFSDAIQSKDKNKIIQIMNKVWFIKFDKPSKFFIPGWGTLCDLCADEDIYKVV